ncbi:MAG TPA: alpha/beta fold hydrolase [Dehalococcoidia bacterium]|nr:alpha/beta fold hydrolase [Dehalococcoidia bacterium]
MPHSTPAHHYAELPEVMLHYVTAGEGDPIVLLHGWPQTWYEWRRVIPALADRYRVIAPDLRGLGDSSRPAGGYDKRTIAADLWSLLRDHMGLDRYFLVGHDWGGPVAYALAAAHPESVRRLAILDVVIPGDGAETLSQGGRRWHHAFHQTLDLPEALTYGRERVYLSWFYRTFAYRPDAITEADIAEYLRTYTQPGAMRAGFAYYRAIPRDIADNRAVVARFKLPMPVLGLGGDKARGRGTEVVESLRRVATDARGEVVPDCGHFIPEEQPEFLIDRLLAFFGEE